jgi:probable ATP-dependent RNA helicase DDX4
VFVEEKRQADFLAAILSEYDYPTTSIHGDRLQPQREIALRDFKQKRMKILVATSVASRGLGILSMYFII